MCRGEDWAKPDTSRLDTCGFRNEFEKDTLVSDPGKINDSDILTKAVSGAGIRKSLIRLGFEIRDKSLLQKETKKVWEQ